ncbi:MAG: hypothetical protein C0490_18370 [Marivirga sp.]|nr:hypothetical protein [Marivirga sp.]
MTNRSYSLQEEQSILFFKEIKSNLGFKSTQRIVKLVRAVLSHLRRSLSHEQTEVIIKNLPSLFQLLFVANWKYQEETSVKHLDELVDNIYKEDQKSKDFLFTSEIDTLNTVILVLSKLDKFFGILGLNVLRYSLTQELKQASIGDAA